ncbi:MAG: AraC family transcriptional regulator [Alloprevotella sp.]|nr:AraC family transcriptional regulator [Alloprevotella sp.]
MPNDIQSEKIKSLPHINSDYADSLFVQIFQKIVIEKQYRNPNYSATQLSRDLSVNPRYISEVLAIHTGENYHAFVNRYRLRDARGMLLSQRYAKVPVEEVGLLCGFASRQAFYLAFSRAEGITPMQYRKMNPENQTSL